MVSGFTRTMITLITLRRCTNVSNGSVKLDIPLNNGVYALPSEGGVGKSYVYQILSMAIDKGYPIATVSYNHGLTILAV